MRIGVLCATFRARRLHAGLVHDLLRQDDTLVCDCHANLKSSVDFPFARMGVVPWSQMSAVTTAGRMQSGCVRPCIRATKSA